LPARHYWRPGNTRTIVGNDPVANHPQSAHFEFGLELGGSHAAPLSLDGLVATTLSVEAGGLQCPYLALQRPLNEADGLTSLWATTLPELLGAERGQGEAIADGSSHALARLTPRITEP
jgi:hypothetical protein